MSSTPRPPSAPQSGSSPPELETLPVTAREDRPLGSYALLLTAFGIGAAAAGVAIARRDGARDAEQTWRWEDLLLLGVASHRVAMTIARDRVTTPLRAPFVHYERDPQSGELSEAREGRGMKRALGQLVTCPFCLATWVAGALVSAMSLAPRVTRTIVEIFAVNAVADFANVVFDRLKCSG